MLSAQAMAGPLRAARLPRQRQTALQGTHPPSPPGPCAVGGDFQVHVRVRDAVGKAKRSAPGRGNRPNVQRVPCHPPLALPELGWDRSSSRQR